jgi:pSer/pThr/pTyr-binding forkhead associated (FHA) protein
MQALKQLEFTFLAGPEEGKTYTFKSKSVAIGSARGNDLVIKDQYIDAQHAVVAVEEHGIVLQNRAVNGATFVNGNRIERCLIDNDDQIAFGGGTTLKFRYSDVSEGFQAPFRTPVASTFRLLVVSGALKGMSYEYTREQVVLGSRRGSDLLLSDSGVEPEHARIVSDGSELVIHNRSAAGVKVNGKLVERQTLHNGDKIELAGTVLTFQEVLGDVRLAKPRKAGTDGTPLQRSAKTQTSIFKSPVVLGGLILYFWGFIFVIGYVVLGTAEDRDAPFGGGFGFHSVARGILITKSIGQEYYESAVRLRGQPEEGSFQIVSGKTPLYSSDPGIRYPVDAAQKKTLEQKWPKSPPYRRLIISDSDVANRCLNLAREYYASRNLNPSGLYLAISQLRRAEAHCPESEATTKRAIRDALQRAELDLFEFFEDSWERAYIKARAKDYSGAAGLYEFIRKLLPDDKNPGNKYARSAQLSVTPKD